MQINKLEMKEDGGWTEKWTWEKILDNLNKQRGRVLCEGELVCCEAMEIKVDTGGVG